MTAMPECRGDVGTKVQHRLRRTMETSCHAPVYRTKQWKGKRSPQRHREPPRFRTYPQPSTREHLHRLQRGTLDVLDNGGFQNSSGLKVAHDRSKYLSVAMPAKAVRRECRRRPDAGTRWGNFRGLPHEPHKANHSLPLFSGIACSSEHRNPAGKIRTHDPQAAAIHVWSDGKIALNARRP